MKRSILLGSVSATLLVLTLLASPYCFAGHGGGFGGGGFHGGAGGGFHGGGSAYHGGGYGGYHGGYSGGGYHASGYSYIVYYRGYHHGGYYAGYRGAYYPWRGGYGWHGRLLGLSGWGFGIEVSTLAGEADGRPIRPTSPLSRASGSTLLLPLLPLLWIPVLRPGERDAQCNNLRSDQQP